MELWNNPFKDKEIETVGTYVNGQSRQVVVDRKTREPIRDRFGRVVSGTTSDGCFRVYAVDGHEVVSGYVTQGDMRINMYTGEAFKNGHRVRLPDRGPFAGNPLALANERAPVRRYDR
tara:strand:- start:1552 stop:1905 length:354 start_codon:yes stop_codon:yes gene_type:complete